MMKARALSLLQQGRTDRLAILFAFALLTSFLLFSLIFTPPAHAATNVSGNISQNTTWTTAGSPYVLNGTVTLNAGVTLTVQPGVVVKGQPTSALTLKGTLLASQAVFTSIKDDAYGGDTNGDGAATMPAPGDWGIMTFARGGGGTLDTCTVLYGGYGGGGLVSVGYQATPVAITGATVAHSSTRGLYVTYGAPAITGSTISNNQNGGLYASVPLTTLSGNVFSANSGPAVQLPANIGANVSNNTYTGNAVNGMFMSGSITAPTVWPASNSPYVLYQATTTVANNLTIEPGAVVKFKADLNGESHINVDKELVLYGTLNATGVVFTSYFDDSYGGDTNGDGSASSPLPGDWKDITFSHSAGLLDSCIIRYGGSPGGGVGYQLAFGNQSTTTVRNSAISNSAWRGIYVSSSTPSIHNNDIFTNASGMYAGSGFDAANNWWGGKGGPKPYGTGNEVTGTVAVAPWSDVPFTQAGAEAQALGTDTWCGAYGEPVNTSTGAFYYEHEDISIPTKGLPLDFKRTYNSNDAGDGPLGPGWSFNWQLSANPRANGDVVILRGDGRRDTFIKNPDNSYSAPSGRHDVLTKNPDGTYKLKSKEQITYNFNAENRLASVVSETGQATALTYDANKRLATITEPAGRSLAIAYNTANRIDHVTDPQGHTVAFGYSAAGDLTSVTDQNAGVTAIAYDPFHHITSITDPNGHAFVNNIYDAQGKVASQTDAEGNLLTFDYSVPGQTQMTTHMDPNDPSKDETTVHYYDAQLRLTRETDPLGRDKLYSYDALGNRASTTDRRGVISTEVFDAAGNATDTYKALGRSEEQHSQLTYNAKNHPLTKTDPRGFTTSFSYDASGSFLTQISHPQVTNYDTTTSSYIEAFTYNPDGTLATSTDKNGDVTSYSYDAYGSPDIVTKNVNRPVEDQLTLDYDFDLLGRKTRFVDARGHETTYEYNAIGDLRYVRTQVTNPDTGLPEDVVTEYQYDANGNKTAVIDPEGRTTTYAYTTMDNLSLITDAKLNTIEHTYDAAYNRTATKDRNGNWTHFAFDKNNNLVSATDPENNTTSYTLDEEANQTAATDPLGRTITRTYDGLGRMTSLTEPDEGGAQRTTSYTYDAADNLLSTTDPGGSTYSQVYDELSRLKQATDPLSNSVFYRYDGAGNRTKMKDQRGYETAFAYSPNDLLTAVTDPLASVTSYGYDKNGNRTSQVDAENHTTLYSFDELNRITNEKVDAGSGSYLLEKSYRYDKVGNLTRDITGEGDISYSYDDAYNMIGLTDRQGASFSFTYDANQNQLTAVETATNQTVTFSYSPRGLLSQATDALGATESFTYDAAANLTQKDDLVAGQNFTTTFEHTPRNQVKTVTRGSDTSTFSFDPAGRLAAKTYTNGVTTSFSYDANGRLTAQNAVKDAQSLSSFAQSYDAAGNITQLTENGTLTTNYGYDELNRLTFESISGYGNIAYSYAAAGNRLTLDNPTTGHTDYSYNQANQLTQQVTGSLTTDYSYNANGAITQKTDGIDTTSYSYNGLDKLTEVVTPSSTINYGYDALGRRISRSEWGGTRNTHFRAKSDIASYETDASGALTASMLSGPDGLIAYTYYGGGDPFAGYQLFNPHVDTATITDVNGAIIYNSRYDSFGNAITGGALDYGYTGKWQRPRDFSTNTIQMGVRDYDPGLGRFLSEDPLKGDTARPLSINRYGYALNDPLTYYDLDGQVAAVPVLVVGTAVLIGVAAYESDPAVQSANKDIGRGIVEGVEGAASSISDGLEGVWNGWFGDDLSVEGVESDRGQGCEIPPMPIEDFLTGSNIQYKVKVRNKEGGRAARDAEFHERIKGGTRIYDPGYPGERYRLPDGTYVGRRDGSDDKHAPTLDINEPNKNPEKWKYEE